MSQTNMLVRSVRSSLLPSWLLLSLVAGCGGLVDPDPYTGTIDPSAFDKQYKFQPTSREDPVLGCLMPRRGWDGTSLSDGLRFYYLGALFATQLDLSGAFDTARALPPSVYQLTGCNAPEGRNDPGDFDIRLHNYDRRVQYPILSQGLFPVQVGGASEPAAQASYKPFHLMVQAALGPSVRDRMGCNDVKRELSLLERAGWDRATKVFPDGTPKDYDFAFQSREQLKTSAARWKDWPMVNVGVPVGRSLDPVQACPFVTGTKAVYPKTLSDSAATFQFPAQAWFRGLLSGYLDGGDLPVLTEQRKCPALFDSGRSCKVEGGMPTGCSFVDGEVCTATDATKPGTCLVPPPVCPVINDLYVSKDEFVPPGGSGYDASDPLPRSKAIVTLADPADMTKTRKADALAMFAAAPGQPGFSPVCRVSWVDVTKLSCAKSEPDAIRPRPLCTVSEILSTPTAIVPTAAGKDVFVHCLFLAGAK
jgi:hypothetical protein